MVIKRSKERESEREILYVKSFVYFLAYTYIDKNLYLPVS